MSNAVVDDLRSRATKLRQNVEARRTDRALAQADLDTAEAADIQSLKMADDLDAAAETLSQ